MKTKHPDIVQPLTGMLIGTREPAGSHAEDVVNLRIFEKERTDAARWQVFDVAENLGEAYAAHKELLDVAREHEIEVPKKVHTCTSSD